MECINPEFGDGGAECSISVAENTDDGYLVRVLLEVSLMERTCSFLPLFRKIDLGFVSSLASGPRRMAYLR